MKCKNCRRDLPENALYCCWCGDPQIKNKTDYKIPEPKQRNGYFSGRVVINGHKVTITGKTKKEYFQNAQKAKSEKLEIKQFPTLEKAISNYIDSNSEVLSPSTIRGYDSYLRNRFKKYMPVKIDQIDYQVMLNEEAKTVSAKTVRNCWRLVTPSLEYAGFNAPKVNLPQVAEPKTDFLNHKEIIKFLQAVKGDKCELAALLALHSLRASELYALTPDDIKDGYINIRGSIVRDKTGKWVSKETNKNRLSTRRIPIVIPRIMDLLPESGQCVTLDRETVRQHLIKICKKAKLPIVSLHDLRRSFSSLGSYLLWQESNICAMGGWSPGSATVHRIYIKTSDLSIKEDAAKMAKYLKKAGVREVSDLDSSSMAKSPKK